MPFNRFEAPCPGADRRLAGDSTITPDAVLLQDPTYYVLRRDAVQLEDVHANESVGKPVVILEARDAHSNEIVATAVGDDEAAADRDLCEQLHRKTGV